MEKKGPNYVSSLRKTEQGIIASSFSGENVG